MSRNTFVRRQISESPHGRARKYRIQLANVLKSPLAQRASKIAIGLICVFIILSVAAYTIPTAEVVLIPETRVASGVLPITFDSTATDTDRKGSVGALHVKKTVSLERSVPTTGSIDIGTKARGSVMFTNRTGVGFPLLSDQRIRGGDTQYYTVVSDIVIPGATVSPEGDVIPGTVEAEVEAVSGGDRYALPEGRVIALMTVPPEKQDKIFGYVSKAISGGTSQIVRSVSDTDVQRAIEELLQSAKQDVRQEFQGRFGQDVVMSDNLLFFVNLSTSTVPAVSEPASDVLVKCSADVVGVAFQKKTLEEAIVAAIKATTKLDSSEQLFPEVGYQVEQPVQGDEQAYTVKAIVSYSGSIIPLLPIDSLSNKLLGMPENKVRQLLLSQKGVRDVHITQRWNLFSTFPTNPNKIHIKAELPK